MFDQSGNATAPGSWVPTSDARLKTDIKRIDEPLMKMGRLRGCTWMRLDTGLPGIGFLAQEVADVFPDVVTRGQDVTLADGSVIEGVLSPDTYGVAAALHHEAILALINEVNELKRMLSVEMKGS
ncbi:tail fiber domain-containing protein [Enterobacter roggenkampii]|nr:tail fiber domain-containing protein [Enterobacter roggenkampii]